MKIVGIDNYNRDAVADVLVAENVHDAYAQLIVDTLNQNNHCIGGDYFYEFKSDDYRLSKGMEDLV